MQGIVRAGSPDWQCPFLTMPAGREARRRASCGPRAALSDVGTRVICQGNDYIRRPLGNLP
jgi:hypothetical protein